MIDRELSLRIGKRVRARSEKCFSNALRAVLLGLPELEGAVYVEGAVLMQGSLVPEHAWLELPDGRVIDPTLPDATDHTPAARYSRADLSGQRRQPFTDSATMRDARARFFRTHGCPHEARAEGADARRLRAQIAAGWKEKWIAGMRMLLPPKERDRQVRPSERAQKGHKGRHGDRSYRT